jgi:pimeloyl-ACP methyl ester carboxylesterase
VIVFLHGLLSTDLCTFEVLINFLRNQGLREEDFAFVGWPHDTLTRIEFNATELASDIEHALGKGATDLPKLAFVCHSRGGLLARYAAAILYEREVARWSKQLGGCVTFGTPHLGSGLADAPDQLIACFIAAGAWRESGRIAGLSDVLWIAKNNDVLEGVEDLRTLRGKLPKHNRDPFQKTLGEKERMPSPKTERILDILAVGGRIEAGAKWYYDLAGRALAGVEHDVAVPLDSSLPRRFPRKEPPIASDHFSYFAESRTMEQHYLNVAQYLKNVLNLTYCEARRMLGPLPAEGDQERTGMGRDQRRARTQRWASKD